MHKENRMTHKNFYRIVFAILVLALASLACQAAQFSGATATPGQPTQPAVTHPASQPTVRAPNITSDHPYEITGTFTYSNDIITTYYVEQAVALVDMYGFVKRDKEWIIPVLSQTLGFLKIDAEKKTGEYSLQLPSIPLGQFVDVDNNGQADTGVQVFAMSYLPNLTGGPYSEGDDKSRGWPSYLASIRTDPDKDDEVIGGKLVVWSPDENQQFPTGFGPDEKLFTADDPVGPIPVGYAIVDLDQTPFTLSQDAKPELTLYEPPDAAIKDFSNDSYTVAFDKMVAFLRTEYAFNGINGKQPDWDKLVASIRPRVEQAEKNTDAAGFYAALRDFNYAFKDGHVGLSAGDLFTQDFQANYAGSLGFNVRVLDDGRVLVKHVLPGGPAADAGMQAGAVITKVNGRPVREAIDAQPLFFGLQSSDVGILYSKALVLTRTKPGEQAEVSFKNPGGQEQSARLKAIPEVDNLLKELGYDQAAALLPVELQTLSVDDKTIGYIKINSNYDDLNLIIRLFERGLKEFQEQKVSGIIIDLRSNGGGANLGLAGFLTDQEITLGQLAYYNSNSGKFEPEGEPDKVTANENQYHFDKMALLVGLNCASACELEAYGFSQVPGMLVIGQYPTGGIEAEVSRGQIKMPAEIEMQFPTGREVLPDGSLFLEGQGVQPTIRVPVDEATVLSSEDVVLKAAEDAVLGK
jgi:C-terminal processing protease CtpA/Prc